MDSGRKMCEQWIKVTNVSVLKQVMILTNLNEDQNTSLCVGSLRTKCKKEENEPPSNKRWFVVTKNKNWEERRTRCFVTRRYKNKRLHIVTNNDNGEGLSVERRLKMVYLVVMEKGKCGFSQVHKRYKGSKATQYCGKEVTFLKI